MLKESLNVMPRPPKARHVEFLPEVTFFKPAGIPLRELEEVILTIEELEAIRLKDLENLEQGQCAEKMNISRPTFQRVLGSARTKIALALVEGKAIRVEGGNYKLTEQYCRCLSCKQEFEIPGGPCLKDLRCPNCNAKELERLHNRGEIIENCGSSK